MLGVLFIDEGRNNQAPFIGKETLHSADLSSLHVFLRGGEYKLNAVPRAGAAHCDGRISYALDK